MYVCLMTSDYAVRLSKAIYLFLHVQFRCSPGAKAVGVGAVCSIHGTRDRTKTDLGRGARWKVEVREGDAWAAHNVPPTQLSLSRHADAAAADVSTASRVLLRPSRIYAHHSWTRMYGMYEPGCSPAVFVDDSSDTGDSLADVLALQPLALPGTFGSIRYVEPCVLVPVQPPSLLRLHVTKTLKPNLWALQSIDHLQ